MHPCEPSSHAHVEYSVDVRGDPGMDLGHEALSSVGSHSTLAIAGVVALPSTTRSSAAKPSGSGS